MIDYVLHSLPLVAALVIWAIRLETKIASIQTDITWLKKEIPGCRQTLEDRTP
ncbi:unnamed protein product [marine sediment metagenome]|uniref:YvrJ family protein n=1 Tax=marine sediment metagenome TaxID=412755 RepID=X1HWT5_9ZZZZ